MELNDLLSEASVDLTRTLVLRHRPTEPQFFKALPLLAGERLDLFNAYQCYQGGPLEKSIDQLRLRTHNQKMTVAAMQMALMKVWAHRSYRVAMRRQSFSLPNIRSTRLRCL